MLPAHGAQATNDEMTDGQRSLNLLTDLRLIDQSYFNVDEVTK
jgi:hypothetical protein